MKIILIIMLFLNAEFVSAFNVKKAQGKPFIPVEKKNLYATVDYLASLKPARNYRNKVSINRAADYIKAKFNEFGYKTETQTFKSLFKVAKDEYRNIICSYGPPGAERIIVGAHYDVALEQPGADDNASAVAGLIELARLFKEQNPAVNCRVDFVAYALEEPPFFRTISMGSAVHAKSLYDAKIKVKAMLSLEMIGYFSNEKYSQDYPMLLLKLFYPSKGNFIGVVGRFGQGKLIKDVKNGIREGSNINVETIAAPQWLPGVDFSDHMNYWKYGYSAVMVTDTSFYRNYNYHNSGDTIDTLDFDRMSEVVKGVYQAVLNLAGEK